MKERTSSLLSTRGPMINTTTPGNEFPPYGFVVIATEITKRYQQSIVIWWVNTSLLADNLKYIEELNSPGLVLVLYYVGVLNCVKKAYVRYCILIVSWSGDVSSVVCGLISSKWADVENMPEKRRYHVRPDILEEFLNWENLT
jgi:hypothetical protein